MNTATVTYLRGVRFSNAALPKIWPFSVDNYISKGLRFAVQPQHNAGSMKDLSGNGMAFTQIGEEVSFTKQGVICRGALGMFKTDSVETLSYTGVVVFRLHRIAETWQNSGVLALSCYGALTSHLPTPISAGGGTIGYAVGYDDAIDSYILHRAATGTFNPETGNFGTASLNIGNEIPRFAHAAPSSSWVFAMGGVDSDAQTHWAVTRNIYMNFQTSSPQPVHTRFTAYDPIGWALGGPGRQYSAWSAMRVEIACAAVWDRPLSTTEQQLQYENTRALCQTRGILI